LLEGRRRTSHAATGRLHSPRLDQPGKILP
jgi:hypothetical protein